MYRITSKDFSYDRFQPRAIRNISWQSGFWPDLTNKPESNSAQQRIWFMIGRVALLVTFKKVKPKPQSLSRSHIRDLEFIILSRNRHLRFLADEWNSGYWMCSDCSRIRPLLSLNNANFLSHWTSLLFQHTQKMLLGILKWKGRMDGSRNWTPRKIQGEHTLCSPG